MEIRYWRASVVAAGAAVMLAAGPLAPAEAVVAATATVVVSGADSDPVWDPTPQQAVAFLNAQRAANGIPAGLTFSPTLSVGCAKHNQYMLLNTYGHGEDPSKPGYTPEGAGVAVGYGGAEVLAFAPGPWDDEWLSPWDGAPLHLHAMFNPANATAGWDGSVYACMRLAQADGYPQGVYVLPGDGATGVPFETDTSTEAPYSPAGALGMSKVQQETLGFTILLWRFGATADVASASLVGPHGAVDVRVVDSRTPRPGGGTWTWGTYLVLPRPLDPGSGYTLDVTFTDSATHHSTFRTAERSARLSVSGPVYPGTLTARVNRSISSPVSVWADGPTGTVTLEPRTTRSNLYEAAVPPGSWTVCARTGGPGTGYQLQTRCMPVQVSAPQAKVKLKPKNRRSKLLIDVNPNKGSGYWKFRAQRQAGDGTWKSLKTYRTKGAKERRKINLRKGTYRVVVRAKYGRQGVTSRSVSLRR